MQEERLAADLRHDNRLAAFDDAAHDALTEPIMLPLAVGGNAVSSFNRQFVVFFIQQHDGATNHAVLLFEDFQHAMQRRFQIERA